MNQLQLKLKKILSKVRARVAQTYSANWSDILTDLALVAIIITLSYNVYASYTKGSRNLGMIESEASKLQELEAEQAKLVALEKYYNSIEFKRNYARDSLNLAEPGETLYYVVREEEYDFQNLQEETNHIDLEDNRYWWKRLILGG